MKHNDYLVIYNGPYWLVYQNNKKVSSHGTQQAAIDSAQFKAGIDLKDLNKKLVDVYWQDREGNLQGHHDNRSILAKQKRNDILLICLIYLGLFIIIVWIFI